VRIRREGDVLVSGGGTAGAIATVAAARGGGRTRLVAQYEGVVEPCPGRRR
jgi:alkyl hydroperoxide reductase subunit AhpF